MDKKNWVPFNRPFISGRELDNIRQAHADGQLAADGQFTRACQAWLKGKVGCASAHLTHSCTAALEMAAMLIDVRPGDEVILPSYTFVSTANAFVLRGGVPVFVDIREDTLNLDESLVEAAISPRTKAILPVHYAGVSCEMDSLMEIANRRRLVVVEDAAQALGSRYRGRPLGSFGQMAALSFHETKNVISGEGGALLINDAAKTARAEVIRQKGTDRARFLAGEVDKYTWVDLGSSYPPSELVAAFLYAQLEQAEEINRRRMKIWETYHSAFEDLEAQGRARRPRIPADCTHNAHAYYLLVDEARRPELLSRLKARGVGAIFHFVPLHDSPAGRKYGRASGSLEVTSRTAAQVVRLPLWLGIEDRLPFVIDVVRDELSRHPGGKFLSARTT